MKHRIVFALGFFDGVHLGHQALLRACRELAYANGAIPGAVTFDGHPEALLQQKAPKLINTLADREKLLRQYGIETVLTFPFDRALMEMPWEDFFRMLLERGAAGFVCGEDFRFGHRGIGNARLLAEACQKADIPCVIVPQQELDGIRISSSHIRQLLEAGETETAVRFLGHPHIFTGTVVPGRQLGRTMGIPTANLRLSDELLVPKFGVYACKVRLPDALGGRKYPAVTNVGTRPTVEGHHITVESWLLDFDGDLYGHELTLEFHAFLRPEKKFSSLEELQAEIQKNAAEVAKIFEKD